MQLLSSIADLKDIVNKEYIDSILANYVLSANLGALATKDSLAFSDLTSRPSKLSDFTDDVVAGKYLELSGGRMQGSINWAIEQTSAWDNFFNTGSNLGLRILNTAGYSVEGAPSDYAVGLIVSGYYGYALAWDANNEQLKYRGSGKSDWRTLLHSGNYSDYALPKSGGTLTGGLTISSGNLIISSSGGGDTVTNKIYPNADNTYALGQTGRRWSDIKTLLINGGTPIHSGNIGDQSVAALNLGSIITTKAGLDAFNNGVSMRIAPVQNVLPSPIKSGDGIVISIPWANSTFGVQLAFDDESNAMLLRTRLNSVWLDWKTVAFTDSNVASADSAKVISDYSNSRITSADVEVFGDGGVRKFIASSYMTSGKPPRDGSILHFSWDTTSGYEHQLFIANDKSATPEQRMAWRTQDVGVWGDWKTIAFTDSNVASATKLATARTIWGQSFDGTGDVSGLLTASAGISTPHITIGGITISVVDGALKIDGNVFATGQLATGEAGQPTSGGGSVQYWSNEYDMDIGTDVLVSSKEYIGTNTIVGWDLAGSCMNDLYIGFDGYTIWMQGSVDEASDMRLKTVIDAVNLDIRDIAYAPIFNYVFKSRPQGRQMLGSSAQYWQAIAPKAVSENDKGNLAMNYGAIALASVVAVAKKVVTHEEEIANLKLEVQDLKQRLAKYELN